MESYEQVEILELSLRSPRADAPEEGWKPKRVEHPRASHFYPTEKGLISRWCDCDRVAFALRLLVSL